MRFHMLLSFLAAFTASVQGQDALSALAKNMPKCSLACFAQELPKSSCAANLTSQCLCTNDALNAAVAVCSKESCTVFELLQTKNVSSKGCGAPVRDNGKIFVVLGITGITVAVISFILRMAASLGRRGRQVSWDDATMGIVVLLAIPPAVQAPFLVKNGLGRDMWTLQAHEITNVLKLYFLGEIFYVVALGISKVSILFFYLRVFPSQRFRILTYAVMGLSMAYTIAFFFATTFQCAPISHAWNQWDGLHQGRCNNIHLQGWIAAAINIALDTVVMVLPLKHLANLNMTLKKRIMVMAMFSLGIFVIIVSTIRLYSLIHFANSQNITWDYVEAGYWSLIEIDVSIVCGCMPAHRALIAKAWPKIKTTFHSSKGATEDKSGLSSAAGNNVSDSNKFKSIKPKIGDEGDFVPLVDVDTSSDRAVKTRGAPYEQDCHASEWITQTSRFEVTHTSASDGNARSGHQWALGQGTSKGYV